MSKINEALWNELKDVENLIKMTDIEEEGGTYRWLLDKREKILSDLSKLEQVTMEVEVKKYQIDNDNKTKLLQIETEKKIEKNRNIKDYITTGSTIVCSVIGLYLTFSFDRTSTVTSTLGKGILNGVVPKLFRR